MAGTDKDLKLYEQPYTINLILLIFSITFFILKLFFSYLTNSVALQADAYDNLTDIVMCITALIGILFAQKKPSQKFPYGYYKVENIISLIFSLFIFFTAYNIILQSVSNILDFINGNPKTIRFSPIIFLFLILSVLASLILALYLRMIYKKTNSPIIDSEAHEKMLDSFISLSVLISFISALFNFMMLDSIIGLIIAIFIIKGGYEIFLTSTKTLLDAVIDFEDRTELYNLIEKTPKIKKIQKMEIRSYGKYIFLELEIQLSKNFPISQINALKNKLIQKIKNRFQLIFKIRIIISSPLKTITNIAVPLKNNDNLDSNIAEHFGDCPYFGFLEFQNNKLLKYDIIENIFLSEEKRKGLLISDWLITKKVDKIYLKKELKKGPSLVFSNNFVEIEIIELNKLNEIVKKETES
ncbi:MAG: cation diffusion facilitator family transporter [Promethearchaeota archaeon]